MGGEGAEQLQLGPKGDGEVESFSKTRTQHKSFP